MLTLERSAEDYTKLSIDELFDRLSMKNDYGHDPLEMDVPDDLTDENLEAKTSHYADWLDGKLKDNSNIAPERATKEEAALFLTRFFTNKKRSFGGPINPAVLLTNRNIELVLRMDLIEALPIYHKCLKEPAVYGHHRRSPMSIRERAEHFINLSCSADKMQIPKENFGGILLVYLNLCLGFNI